MDALQVAREFSGVGRQALEIGAQLRDLPPGLALEVRCAADVAELFADAFAPGTRVRTPIARSRPRLLRIAYQQLVAPAVDDASTLVVALGDQAPLWGRARVLLVVNDVRRLTDSSTSSPLEALYYRLLVPRALRRADAVATISDFSRGELARILGRDARVVAHHPRPRALEPRRDEQHVLVVGALRTYKGAETVVDALAELEAPPRVVFAGPAEGRGEALVARARARGVEGSVVVLGWVDDDRLEELRAQSLATINPSAYEGYGLGVGESLARGLPTIASDIPPHREIAGDAALYFTPGDARELASAIAAIADESRRENLARLARARARELARLEPTWRTLILDAATGRTGSRAEGPAAP